MKKFILCLCLFLSVVTANSQTIRFIPDSAFSQRLKTSGFLSKALIVGEVFSDSRQYKVANYKLPYVSFPDLRGKLLILDFWATNCPACISSFPKMEALQSEFGDKIQIFLINSQSEDSTKKFFAKRKKIKIPTLPLIFGDTILKKQFPYNGLPQHVWINPNGVVQYITSGEEATKGNVQAVLDQKQPKLFRKKILPYSMTVQIEENTADETVDEKLIAYSSLMKKITEIDNYRKAWIIDPATNQRIGVHFESASIVDLYRAIFAKSPIGAPDDKGIYGDYFWANRVLLKVKNPEKLMVLNESKRDSWYEGNSYRYILKVPNSNTNELFEIMRQQINAAFNLRARIEKHKVNCLALTLTTDSFKIRSKGGKPFSRYSDNGDRSSFFDSLPPTFTLINTPLEVLINNLNFYNRNLVTPVVDNTGLSKVPVDIVIQSKLDDLENLNKQLRKSGLQLIEKECEIDLLVIEDAN